MARLNSVHFRGIVSSLPERIQLQGKLAGKTFVHFTVTVTRGIGEVLNGQKTLELDEPDILIYEHSATNVIKNLQPGDTVYLRGVITTAERRDYEVICTECGHTETVSHPFVYVTPVHIEKTGHLDTDEEKQDFLMGVRFASNEVELMGRLTRDPSRVMPKSMMVIAQYQIAINRSFRIDGAPPELKTDYPWVKSYRSDAEEDLMRLKLGSIVLINGYFQTRCYMKHCVCSECNVRFDYQKKVNEITPFSTEYLINYRSDEEIEALKKEREEQSLRDRGYYLND